MRSQSTSTMLKRLTAASAALLVGLAAGPSPVFAQDTGHGHTEPGHTSPGGDDHGENTGGQGQAGRGRTPGETGGRSHGSLEDIFREVSGADTADEEEGSGRPEGAGERGPGGDKGSGRPATAGTPRGDLFGDLWVILRDENGVPILSSAGFVQPLDANGNLIPLDAEGAPIDPTLVVEVELGRLNVGRAPTKVLDRRAEEVITLLREATAISLDPAGRLVLTVDGVAQTIDSPLENLAIYVALMTTGSIPGLTDLPGTEFDHLVDGQLTVADMVSAASFLAAATDKSSPFTADEVAYINAFLGISTATQGTVTYSNVDYSAFVYDRSDAYTGATAEVLVQQPNGSWLVQTVNLYVAVLGSTDYTGSGTLDAFTQAAEDARAVVEFLHEYAVPADSTTTP